MKIQVLKTIITATHSLTQDAIIDMEDSIAQSLIVNGFAEEIKEDVKKKGKR